MAFPREVLNDLKWHLKALDEAEITYIHRGAPGDTATIGGKDVTALGRSFFEVGDSSIPYHRIVCITVHGRVIWPEPTAAT
jgi:uncharacterized protein (UPF0248 family)